MIFAVVIGGLGTIEGPIIGAAIFFVLQQLLVRLRVVVSDPHRRPGRR